MGLNLTRKLTEEEMDKINKFTNARHMKLNLEMIAEYEGITVDEVKTRYGSEAEYYYVDDADYSTLMGSPIIIDVNKPPADMPSVYCTVSLGGCNTLDFEPYDDSDFYPHQSARWIKWLLENMLLPIGVSIVDEEIEVSGDVEIMDSYLIVIKDDQVRCHPIIYDFDLRTDLI